MDIIIYTCCLTVFIQKSQLILCSFTTTLTKYKTRNSLPNNLFTKKVCLKIILILKPRSKSEVCQLNFTLIINTDPCIFEIDIVMN